MKPVFRRVILFVDNVRECARFYVEHFEFEHATEQENDEWMELRGGGFLLAFHRAHGGGGGDGADHPHKLVFAVGSVEEERRKLMENGVAMGEVVDAGELKFCNGRDPAGYMFQISNR